MASAPQKKAEDPLHKEWEALWKRFSEVISFMYDNEGVIESLKRKYGREDDFSMKKTLISQIDEIHHLIMHHQHELLSLVEKARKLAVQKGINISSIWESLKKAVRTLNLDLMKKNIEILKKENI